MIIAQRARAVLCATATAATLTDLRASNCFQPGPWRHILPEACSDDRSGPMDQQRTQVAISAFADPADVFLATTGMNSWRQAEPSCEVSRRTELPVRLPTLAMMALAVIGPTPGAEARRWLASEFLCQVTIRASMASIRLVNSSI